MKGGQFQPAIPANLGEQMEEGCRIRPAGNRDAYPPHSFQEAAAVDRLFDPGTHDPHCKVRSVGGGLGKRPEGDEQKQGGSLDVWPRSYRRNGAGALERHIRLDGRIVVHPVQSKAEQFVEIRPEPRIVGQLAQILRIDLRPELRDGLLHILGKLPVIQSN